MTFARFLAEHLGLTLALNVPVFIVVTKIDMAPPNVLADTLKVLFAVWDHIYVFFFRTTPHRQGNSMGGNECLVLDLACDVMRAFYLDETSFGNDMKECESLILNVAPQLLVKILKSPACRKTPLLVQNSDDVITAATNFTSER
jgi:hypothetical protein